MLGRANPSTAVSHDELGGRRAPARTSLDVRVPTSVLLTVGELRSVLLSAGSVLAGGRRPWFATSMAAASLAVYGLLHDPSVAPAVLRAGAVSASIPLSVELWRLPMSLFLPTAYLPVWGAAAQLFIVLGLAEVLLGRWLTLAVAAVGHVAATLSARAVIEYCPGNLVCLPAALSHAIDTGPSAATTAVGVCLLIATHSYRCAAVLCCALLIAGVAAHGLDGQEHLAALACGLSAGLLVRKKPAASPGLLRLPAHKRLDL